MPRPVLSTEHTKEQLTHVPSSDEQAWICVGPVRDLPKRTQLVVEGRRVTLLQIARGGVRQWTLIDSICYHAGGALGSRGKLSNFAGRPCLTCPVHFFVVDVFSGERVLQSSTYDHRRGRHSADKENGNGNGSTLGRSTQSSDERASLERMKQRVHEVDVRDGTVWIRLRPHSPQSVESDKYAFQWPFSGSKLEW
jgi:nitrite reductase/ring-hydroxylating ferredoxin subunit